MLDYYWTNGARTLSCIIIAFFVNIGPFSKSFGLFKKYFDLSHKNWTIMENIEIFKKNIGPFPKTLLDFLLVIFDLFQFAKRISAFCIEICIEKRGS